MKNLMNEFYSRLIPLQNGCIIYPVRKGYGVITTKPYVRIGAHEFAYILHYKIYPAGEIHHKCEDKRCCNPLHLENLSNSQHQIRHKRKEFCPQGHKYSDVGRTKSGTCIECKRINTRKWREKNPAWRLYKEM